MKFIITLLKGMAMGAADVVPGVSGGTIAFITGIYDKLLESINAVNFGLLKVQKTEGIKAVWEKINGSFLLALFTGIMISIFSLAKVLTHLLETQPILLWSFFFGLILASIVYVGKQVQNWNWPAIIGLSVGTILVFAISTLPPSLGSTSLLYLFVCGIIAICAMILPGISGSFLLLILGVYPTILSAVSERNFKIIFTFGLGAIVGLLSFSRLLKWVLKRYHNVTIALLTGFLVGSLYKIWPWKITTRIFVKHCGEANQEMVSLAELAVWPNAQFKVIGAYTCDGITSYAPKDPQMMLALLFIALGFGILFGIEKIADVLKKQ